MEPLKNKKVEWVLEVSLLLGSALLVIALIININALQGNARTINYAGVARSATQAIVAQEATGTKCDGLIEQLDTLLAGLRDGGTVYQLTPLPDQSYIDSLEKQMTAWGALKLEIQKTRTLGKASPNIYSKNNEYYISANQTVALIEAYTEGIAGRLKYIEFLLIGVIFTLIAMLAAKSYQATNLSKSNSELKRAVSIDSHTGLPNKGCCQEIILRYGTLNPNTQYACIMFDLNNLKKINDRYGHYAGDTLIMDFANILRLCAPQDVFVGRYGGDEFIAILENTSEAIVLDFISQVNEVITISNYQHKRADILFAYGYELSDANSDCTMQVLLDKADRKMYEDKANKKSSGQYGIMPVPQA